jgi:pyrrolidone-carboxylate peptidase
MTILVTGFEPFGGEPINQSWEAVRQLNGDMGDVRIERLLVPTTYADSIGTVTEAIDRLRPAAVSNTAGLFICNHLFYGVLHHIATHNLETQAGFIHVPFLPEQVVGKPGTPSMLLETMVAELDCMVAVLTSNARP